MARFDVYRGSLPGELWLDCQADRLAHLSHRFVVPLVDLHGAPSPSIDGLNPMLDVAGTRYVMLTQFSGAIPVRDLGEVVASIADDDHRIVRAIDTLIGAA